MDLEHFFLQSVQCISVLWLGMKCLVAFKHSSPDVIIKRVNVRRVWWPLIFANKFTAVGGNPVLSQLCSVILISYPSVPVNENGMGNTRLCMPAVAGEAVTIT